MISEDVEGCEVTLSFGNVGGECDFEEPAVDPSTVAFTFLGMRMRVAPDQSKQSKR